MAEMLDGQIGICAAANIRPSRDGSSFDVYPTHGTYRGSEHKYGGIIIYACNSETDWYTANRTHYKSGYIVIMRTDTEEFQDKQNKWGESGRVHGTIYRIAFGESCDDVTIVGEGFGIIGGKFKTTSGGLSNTVDQIPVVSPSPSIGKPEVQMCMLQPVTPARVD